MFRKRYKPVSGMVAAFVLISILVCSVFTAFPHDVKAESENNYLDSAITYQGEENWYNYSGDFSENQLINMFYIQRYGMWQGQSELNRIYNDTLVQVPTADYDAMRAYVVSKEGVLSIGGEIEVFANDDTGDSVRVSVVLVEDGALSETRELLSGTVLQRGDASLDLSKEASLQDVSVGIGDMIFFVAEACEDSSVCGAVFGVNISFGEVSDQAIPQAPVSEPVRFEGDLAFTYDNNGNVLKDGKELITASMATDNVTGNQTYVYQTNGMQTLTAMDFAGYESPGSWYTMPNSVSSVGAVWFNKWYSNSVGGFGNAGLRYTVPSDGTISVLGAYVRSDAVEMGDDATSETESAAWRLIRIRGGVFEVLVGEQPIEKNVLNYFADVAGTQDIEVLAGDQICVQYLCSAAWKTSCMSILFDYVADPVDVNIGWVASGDIPQETYDSTYGTVQGEKDWYYAYGASDGEYYELDNEAGVWTGEDVYSSVSIDHRIMSPSNSSGVMKVWKAIGGGKARIVGNMRAVQVSASGMTFRVSKRSYKNDGWGQAEVLFSQQLNSKKAFAEFNLEGEEIQNGDIVFFEVISANNDPVAECREQLELNCYVDFEATVPAEEVGEGIGAEEYAFTSDWYSDTQGKNGWFYAYGDKDNYVLMDYGFGNFNYALWNGPEWNTAIDATAQYLGAYTGTMRIYVADRDGVLHVLGTAAVVTTDGIEGVNARIYHNGETIWTEEYGKDDRAARPVELAIEVKKGDTVMFYAENKTGNTVAYATEFFYNISISLDSDSTNIVPENELIQYLDAKDSYKDFLGVPDEETDVKTVGDENSGCGSIFGTESGIIAAVLISCISMVLISKRRERK